MRFLNTIRPAFTSPVNRYLTRRQFMQLFVGGLSYDTNESVLKDAFEEYGEIVEVKVICDRVSGKSRGYGFVRYSSEAAATKALIEMNGRLLDGRNIRIHSAHKGESKEVKVYPDSYLLSTFRYHQRELYELIWKRSVLYCIRGQMMEAKHIHTLPNVCLLNQCVNVYKALSQAPTT